MRFIPNALLARLYNRSSLRNDAGGVRFSVKNRLSPASLKRIEHVAIDGRAIPQDWIGVAYNSDPPWPASRIAPDNPVDFPLGTELTFHLSTDLLADGNHAIELAFVAEPFGRLSLNISDVLRKSVRPTGSIPRDSANDYGAAIVRSRQEFVARQTGVTLEHISRYSFDPAQTRGNIEHFIGVAQVPLGIAGPLLVRGEHAQGEFYVPLATSEGTLVASYNRGMKVLFHSGGVRCAVVGDNMQRAPVFAVESGADTRRLADWIVARTDEIKAVCAKSDPFLELDYIDPYLSNKFVFLRFNFTTGDAAGMNMVGKATLEACNWILQHCDAVEIQRFFLESNFATDKKPSMINTMRSRGKRVTAEAVVKRDVLLDIMDTDTESIQYHWAVSNIGTLLSGANNNGCHSANAIAAIFLATGQDAANVAESSSATVFAELTPEKDLYLSVTLPSLIVATCGGGTGLPTQRESLRMMGCCGTGKVKKLAEIVAATVLAGEISLAAAISSLDWVSSHEQLGRNDPAA